MPATDTLAGRIDAEFTALEEKFKKIQTGHVQEYQERQKRLRRLGEVFDQLGEIWRPRLELLQKKFGDEVKVTPRLTPSTREAKFEFRSNLAWVVLKFSATTDRDVSRIILSYDLQILPVLSKFESHAELEMPLDAINPEAAAAWVDDRIVAFVKTYLSLHENERYLKEEMVEDPVAQVRFPKFAAGATLEWQGKTWYFVGEETCAEFRKQNGIGTK
jgi:YHS domain-containing protein